MIRPTRLRKVMSSTIDGAPPGFRPCPIEWHDLAATTPTDAIRELLLPAPWLFGSLILAVEEFYPLALAASFVFFLTGLRVVHGAFHYTLGLPRRATDLVMFAFSVAMLGSMHAVQWNHLRHHRHCLAEDDIEAMGARAARAGARYCSGRAFRSGCTAPPWRVQDRLSAAGSPPNSPATSPSPHWSSGS